LVMVIVFVMVATAVLSVKTALMSSHRRNYRVAPVDRGLFMCGRCSCLGNAVPLWDSLIESPEKADE
jgi:hypothetical protein